MSEITKPIMLDETGEEIRDAILALSENLNGIKGANGKDGYSPVRGKDYWTADDKTEIVNDVLASLPAAEGVSF